MQGKVNYGDEVKIGELAQRAGTTTKTLRFYEQAGLLPVPERTPSGYRVYEPSALSRLAFVKGARSAGLTLAQIREVIAIRDNAESPCGHVTTLLQARASDLEARIQELTALREDIRALTERARGLDPSSCAPDALCHVIPTRVTNP